MHSTPSVTPILRPRQLTCKSIDQIQNSLLEKHGSIYSRGDILIPKLANSSNVRILQLL